MPSGWIIKDFDGQIYNILGCVCVCVGGEAEHGKQFKFGKYKLAASRTILVLEYTLLIFSLAFL